MSLVQSVLTHRFAETAELVWRECWFPHHYVEPLVVCLLLRLAPPRLAPVVSSKYLLVLDLNRESK
jgi:hypothetical protein